MNDLNGIVVFLIIIAAIFVPIVTPEIDVVNIKTVNIMPNDMLKKKTAKAYFALSSVGIKKTYSKFSTYKNSISIPINKDLIKLNFKIQVLDSNWNEIYSSEVDEKELNDMIKKKSLIGYIFALIASNDGGSDTTYSLYDDGELLTEVLLNFKIK